LTSAPSIAGPIDVTPRIGISQAVDWPLRFLLRVDR
jgi:3-methyladenine DNA glycosylase Mpg